MPNDRFPETIYPDDLIENRGLIEQAKEYGYHYVAIFNGGVLNHYKRVRDRKDKKDCGCGKK